jgi:hypothetical protein
MYRNVYQICLNPRTPTTLNFVMGHFIPYKNYKKNKEVEDENRKTKSEIVLQQQFFAVPVL